MTVTWAHLLSRRMFSPLNLFNKTPCPDLPRCSRVRCIFSHDANLPPPPALVVPVHTPPLPLNSVPSPAAPRPVPKTVPAKRPVPNSPLTPSLSSPVSEPPRKQQKIAANKSTPAPSASASTSRLPTAGTGPPVLRVNGAASIIAVPVRQAMLKTLYEHFAILYQGILANNPTLASDHALRQEEEVYKKTNKQTYRVCAAALKRRTRPTSSSDPSVGTEDEVSARAEALKKRQTLHVTRAHVEHLIHSRETLEKWGFIMDIPAGVGGDMPSAENQVLPCERCGQKVPVRRKEDADECFYHWGKPMSSKASGQKIRVYRCCGKMAPDDDGCVRGPHVFYESDPELLHARHAFSYLKPPPSAQTVLDVAALDCEMVYTTGGMRVARVSVIDGSGAEVFDELVRMDPGVEIIDFNTRFSGVTAEAYAKATRPLAEIREALDNLINADTVLIGHGLDNDLNTLRIDTEASMIVLVILTVAVDLDLNGSDDASVLFSFTPTLTSFSTSSRNPILKTSFGCRCKLTIRTHTDPTRMSSAASSSKRLENSLDYWSACRTEKLEPAIRSPPSSRIRSNCPPEWGTCPNEWPPEHALQDPETPSTDPAVSEQRRSPNRFLPRTQPLTDTSPSSFSPLSSYLPDYPALKELHTRLEMSYRVLAIPPVPKRIPTPPPDLSLSSLDKTIQTAKLGLTSTTEAVASAKARVLTAEQNVAAARALVDSLKQALDSASTSLKSAEATLTDAARHASDVNATNESSKQTLGSLEETRRLMLEERQPRPRSPSPAPPKQIMGVMKKDLDAFRTWIDEQEHGHKSTLATHGVKGVTTRPPEEDAAQTLVQFALASQGDHAVASDVPMTFPDSESLAHEAALRKSQEIRREQIRLQKEQAQAAAALSILKEREDHVQEFAAPSVDIATTSAPPYQPQPKKGKPTSGGVKLGLSAGAPSVTEFSTEVERAAALGLRVVYSTPPEPKSSSPEEFSAHRTGSDGGNLPILQPQAHRRLSDAQVVDLRTTLRGPSLPPVEHLPQARSPSPHHTFIKMEETDRRELLHRSSIVSQNTVQKNTPKVVAPKAVTSKVVTQHAPNKSSSKVVAPQVVAPKKAASAKAGAAQPNTATVSKKLAGANKHHSPPPRERSRSPDQYRNRPPSPSGWMPPRISDQHPPPSASICKIHSQLARAKGCPNVPALKTTMGLWRSA
ncbi:unnamed protein product [Mycena citricolor]|uniref:Exonuclease domain-containing protein n=1 Tax=Mycena citricolor TaxID=2018698 RepID=A0AAD2K2P2_9AGAR|nr:unnamed protein product [Mycena citricolor]